MAQLIRSNTKVHVQTHANMERDVRTLVWCLFYWVATHPRDSQPKGPQVASTREGAHRRWPGSRSSAARVVEARRRTIEPQVHGVKLGSEDLMGVVLSVEHHRMNRDFLLVRVPHRLQPFLPCGTTMVRSEMAIDSRFRDARPPHLQASRSLRENKSLHKFPIWFMMGTRESRASPRC